MGKVFEPYCEPGKIDELLREGIMEDIISEVDHAMDRCYNIVFREGKLFEVVEASPVFKLNDDPDHKHTSQVEKYLATLNNSLENEFSRYQIIRKSRLGGNKYGVMYAESKKALVKFVNPDQLIKILYEERKESAKENLPRDLKKIAESNRL